MIKLAGTAAPAGSAVAIQLYASFANDGATGVRGRPHSRVHQRACVPKVDAHECTVGVAAFGARREKRSRNRGDS